MIGDPCILETPRSRGYLVGRKHKITVRSLDEARNLACRILDDPANVQEIRAALNTNDDIDGLTEWLATAIYGQHYHLFVTKPATPTMEEPKVTDIKTLIVDPPRFLEGEQLRLSLVDADFDYVPAAFTLTIAGREVRGQLEDASWREKDLGKNDEAEVMLRGIAPPPRQDDDGDEHEQSGGSTDGGGAETEAGSKEGSGPITATEVSVVVDHGEIGAGWGVAGDVRHAFADGGGKVAGDVFALEGVVLEPPDGG